MRFQATALAGMFAAMLTGLASAAEPATPESPDAVFSLTGDRITGRVIAIGKDGVLRMANGYLDREIGLRISGLRQAVFNSSVREPGPHVLLLTSGDQIVGKVVAINAKQVTVETTVAGKVSIGREYVERIWFSPASGGPPRTDFSVGGMEPFQDMLGSPPAVRVRPGEGGPQLMAGEYAQNRATTMLVELAEGNVPFSVGFFVADKKDWRQNSITVDWTGNLLHIRSSTGGDSWSDAVRNPTGEGGHSLRVAYNPDDGELRVWINDDLSWSGKINHGPKIGRYTVISCPLHMRIARIQFMDGIVKPKDEGKAADKTAEKEEDRDVLVLANGDRVRAETLALADGKFQAKSNIADLTIPLDGVDNLCFRNSGRKPPPVNAKSVLVATNRSAFILDSVELSAKAAFGPSAMLGGEVSVDRAALRLLRFVPDPAPVEPPKWPPRKEPIKPPARPEPIEVPR